MTRMTRTTLACLTLSAAAALAASNISCGTDSGDPMPGPDDNMNSSTGMSGDTCTEDADCGDGLVCEGAGPNCDEPQCITGCRDDADCEEGTACTEVLCITCPCPWLCQ